MERFLVYKNDSNQYTLLPRYTIGIRDGNDVNLGKNEVGPFYLVIVQVMSQNIRRK